MFLLPTYYQHEYLNLLIETYLHNRIYLFACS